MEGFIGALHNIQLNEIIQMFCLTGESLCLRVEKNSHSGRIHIKKGEVVHAECDEMIGLEAFFTILGWKYGQFQTLNENGISQRSIKKPYQFLLLEAARLEDERANEEHEQFAASEDEAAEKKLRILIVDDSPIMTKVLGGMMAEDPGTAIVGCAKNGQEALDMMERLSPDLITMDVNMPVMDGGTALKHIMIKSPCPVLIMSNSGASSYARMLSYFNLGAVDFMSKPVKNKKIDLQQKRIIDRVHMASKVNLRKIKRWHSPRIDKSKLAPLNESRPCENLIIVVSGAGGYLEMVQLLTTLPADSKSAIISMQSIPPLSVPTLASYLNARSCFDVQPLLNQTALCAGRCYIVPNGQDLQMISSEPLIEINPLLNGAASDIKMKSIDSLLSRAAEVYKERVVLVLLSGSELGTMDGLRQIKAAGGRILAPQLEHCILPETLQPAVREELITDLCPSSEMGEMLSGYCQ